MKYPRTPHLPISPGFSADDERNLIDHLIGERVVITEKLDGECTCLSKEKVHARSEDSESHESRDRVKALWAEIRYAIPDGLQIYGENMHARHSIAYSGLDSVLHVFAMRQDDVFLSWEETASIADTLKLKLVPVLYKGTWDGEYKLPESSAYGPEIEGFVVRKLAEFNASEFEVSVAKWVRKDHVKTDEHWKRRWVPNKISG